MSIDSLNALQGINTYKTDLWSALKDKKEEKSFGIAAKSDPANSAQSTNTPTGIGIGANTTAQSLWDAQNYAQSNDVNAIDVTENTDTDKPTVSKPSASERFLDYMNKTPEQLMRESILKSLGYTEDDLNTMDPKERAKVEAQIQDLIEKKIEEGMRKELTGENKETSLVA